jgi:serine/threonine-protein kinase RsbW
MTVAFELKMRSDLSLVSSLARAATAICEEHLTAEQLVEVDLALTEAVTNVIRHGYHEETAHSVRLSIALFKDRIAFELVDQAPPMDPTLLEHASGARFDFDPTDLESLPEGGMGLALIKLNMDAVEYTPRKHSNILRMAKNRSVGSADNQVP